MNVFGYQLSTPRKFNEYIILGFRVIIIKLEKPMTKMGG